jgi:hypothetical protein
VAPSSVPLDHSSLDASSLKFLNARVDFIKSEDMVPKYKIHNNNNNNNTLYIIHYTLYLIHNDNKILYYSIFNMIANNLLFHYIRYRN